MKLKMKDIRQRGWSQEQMVYLLGLTHKLHMDIEQFEWAEEKIESIETLQEFIHFKDAKQASELKAIILKEQSELSAWAIARLESMPPIDDKQSLSKKYHKFKDENEAYPDSIYYQLADINKSKKLYAFSDGNLKSIKHNSVIFCAGWISDEAGNILVEFTKRIKPNEIKHDSHFEQAGLLHLMKLIDSLELSNVLVHTDSSSDAYRTALQCPYDSRNEIAYLLHKTQSQVCYIPRQYNEHADSLTKIPMFNFIEDKELRLSPLH